MEASRGTRNKEGLRVYAMHLMELSERSSAMLMVHKARRNGVPFWTRGRDSDPHQIVVAFEGYQHLGQVSVRPTTAISSISSMHEDICDSAARKKVAMIILPFHKHQRVDGQLETTRGELRHVNRRVLEHAPCSVGILVDRGFGGTSHVAASHVNYTITSFFCGGHDDREALSYAALMAEHPGISLNVVRFLVDPKIVGGSVQVDMDEGCSPEGRWSGHDHEDAFFDEFKQNISKDGRIRVEERVVSNGAEAVDVMRGYKSSSLILVGRKAQGEVVAGLNSRGECPELGALANFLISSEFSASVLVVQHFNNSHTNVNSQYFM